MPSEVMTEAPPSSVHVTAAPFLDFQFVAFLLSKRQARGAKHTIPQWLAAAEATNPAPFTRVVAFWASTPLNNLDNGQPYVEWGETLVLAWHAGVLFAQDVPAALDGIEAQLPRELPHVELASEPAEIVSLLERRMAYLRDNPEAAKEYIATLRGLWEAVEPQWRASAAAEARSMAAQFEQQARTESDLRRIVTTNSFVHKDNYQPQIAQARARGELFVVPLTLGNEGAFYWAFPGAVVIGVGVGAPQKQARKRQRMEDAAGRFKVLSDPTRLSILSEVMHGSHYNATTVTELASLFGLSQPTISVHMKMLREAGLVTTERDGNRTLYTADEAAIKAFIEAATSDLLGSSAGTEDC